MINLRYHIVSITAIFLALGIGVALGGTFLDNYTVDQLNSNISSAEKRIRSTSAESARLKRQIALTDKRDRALSLLASQSLFRGNLTGVPVMVIAVDGIDKASQDTLRATLAGAGAEFMGTVSLTDKLNLDDASAADLAKALNLPSPTVASVRAAIASRLARSLVVAGLPSPRSAPGATTSTVPGATTTSSSTTSTTTSTTTTTTTTTTPAPTTSSSGSTTTTTLPPGAKRAEPPVITALRRGGYLNYQPPEGGSSDDKLLTTDSLRYVVVSGQGAKVPDADMLLPMLRAMTATSGTAPVVMASAGVGDDPEQTRGLAITPIRNDDVLRHGVSTVDDLEMFSGLAATVLALQDLGRDVHGHYGVGDGATSQLPIGP
ncbi:MAG: mctB [Acidimicrobiales bacterium]|nr:mctB [Acidimicrobiales bacterium]